MRKFDVRFPLIYVRFALGFGRTDEVAIRSLLTHSGPRLPLTLGIINVAE